MSPIYIKLDEHIDNGMVDEHVELADGIILDYWNDTLVGIEILRPVVIEVDVGET